MPKGATLADYARTLSPEMRRQTRLADLPALPVADDLTTWAGVGRAVLALPTPNPLRAIRRAVVAHAVTTTKANVAAAARLLQMERKALERILSRERLWNLEVFAPPPRVKKRPAKDVRSTPEEQAELRALLRARSTPGIGQTIARTLGVPRHLVYAFREGRLRWPAKKTNALRDFLAQRSTDPQTSTRALLVDALDRNVVTPRDVAAHVGIALSSVGRFRTGEAEMRDRNLQTLHAFLVARGAKGRSASTRERPRHAGGGPERRRASASTARVSTSARAASR